MPKQYIIYYTVEIKKWSLEIQQYCEGHKMNILLMLKLKNRLLVLRVVFFLVVKMYNKQNNNLSTNKGEFL